VILCVNVATNALQKLVPSWNALTKARVASKELGNVITLDNENLAIGKSLQHCRGKLELQGLSFRYYSRPESKIFDSLSLTLEPGKTTAIVGPSGSGKSRLISLIERWYEPESGQILLDDELVKQLDELSYRSHIGLVQQVTKPFPLAPETYLTTPARIQISSTTPCFRM